MITALKYMAYNFAILKLLGTTRQNRSESCQNGSEPCLNRAQWTRTGQRRAEILARSDVDPAADVQPLVSVTVTLYVPLAADMAFEIDGSWLVDVNPFGPIQL